MKENLLEDKEEVGIYLDIIINQEEKHGNLFNYKNNEYI